MIIDIGALHELRREMKNVSMETNWSTCFVHLLYAMWGLGNCTHRPMRKTERVYSESCVPVARPDRRAAYNTTTKEERSALQ